MLVFIINVKLKFNVLLTLLGPYVHECIIFSLLLRLPPLPPQYHIIVHISFLQFYKLSAVVKLSFD